jgi:2-keto-3-deoxy-L-fuconate dehydrogenase
MGPAICELFEAEGAELTRVEGQLRTPEQVDQALELAGAIDVLVANLALPPRQAVVSEIADGDWLELFDVMVHPLMRLVRGVAPGMIERGGGKIVAITSAAPLRGIAKASAYCAARGAQNAFVRASGIELAARNIQVNAIAQNYVANPTYYPEELLESQRFKDHLERNVPLGRVAQGRETAELAIFLASPTSDFLVGQVIPFAGGWVTTTG